MSGLDRQAKIPAFFVITWGNRELGEEETQDTADRILASRGFEESGSPCQNKQVQTNHVEVEGGSSHQNKQTTLHNQHRPHRARPLARMHARTHAGSPASR